MAEGSTVGENIRAARRYRGMSLDTLAGLVGHSKSWLSKIENGQTRLERRTDIRALAEALEVAPSDILGEPSQLIRPSERAYGDVIRLREVLLESTLDDPLDVQARPLPDLTRALDALADARRASDDPFLAIALPPLLAELHVHVAAGDEHERQAALRMLIEVCTSATNVLRHVGQPDLAWVAADRAERAAVALDDPIMRGAATVAQATSRPSATLSRPLRQAEKVADRLEGQIGDDRTGHEVYGMLNLYAALAAQLQGNSDGADERLTEAERVAEWLGEQPADSCGEGWRSFGPANVGVWRTMLAVEAGRPERALAAAERVDTTRLPRKSRQAALAIEHGRALAMVGRRDAAVRELVRAEKLSVASVHKSPLVRELVADLYDRSTPRDLRGLAWRMNII